MKVGSKKLWVFFVTNFSIVGLAVSGHGDPSAYGALGLIGATTIGALGAIDHKKTPPVRDASLG